MINFKENFGIGVDIEEISRFEDNVRDRVFLDRIFTENELEYCNAKKKPAEHLAARYAGKEAVIKALGSMIDEVNFLEYRDIEVSTADNGAPKVKFTHRYLLNNKNLKAHISLSHCRSRAIAFAVIVNSHYEKNKTT